MEQIKERYLNIQSNLASFLPQGCLFVSVLYVAECFNKKPIDFLDCFVHSLKRGWIKKDGYVNDSLAILKYLTGVNWQRSVYSVGEPLPLASTWHFIEKWVNSLGVNHFRPCDFEIFENCKIVKNGKITGYYFYFPLGV